jgi:hypothetical protein
MAMCTSGGTSLRRRCVGAIWRLTNSNNSSSCSSNSTAAGGATAGTSVMPGAQDCIATLLQLLQVISMIITATNAISTNTLVSH